jgi:hypothetical protein
MPIIYKKYIEQEDGSGIDYCWYSSSNIFFSKCLDIPNKLKKLTIVFNKGTTYEYDNVDVNDYVKFKNAVLGENLMEKSNGKAFHKYIKKYEGIKVEDANMNKLEEQKLEFMKQDKLILEEKNNINENTTEITPSEENLEKI